MTKGLTGFLLDRQPLCLGPLPDDVVAGRIVLVTGAGGFIGSALCLRVAALGVEHLFLLEADERRLHRLEHALAASGAPNRTTPVLGDAGDRGLLEELFATRRPDIILHTAAFKHVPLLESQPLAAVRNNVLATYTLASTAARQGVRRFILLSTDKAVQPVSVMGVSKRIAELIVLGGGMSEMCMTSLRLGNVLGSSGSALPLLRAQLRRREPLTVTHPEAARYFVTRSEAVDLLLLAVSLGQGHDILVPDLARPVKIVDLARRLRDSADVDLPIVFTRLRPGEKLREMLWTAEEAPRPTTVPRVLRIEGPRPAPQAVDRWVEMLETIVEQRDTAGLLAQLREIVPEYQPSADVLELTRSGVAVR